MAPRLAAYRAVMLTVGQLDLPLLQRLQANNPTQRLQANNPTQRLVLRTAAPPAFELPGSIEWIKAIGPFSLEAERDTLRRYGIDLLVSKNSGGSATEAKLHAARELGVELFMLERPSVEAAANQFESLEDCVDWVAQLLVRQTS